MSALLTLYSFSLFPYLRRCISEMFQKHPSKQFIIGESMPFQNYMHRISGCDQIFIDEGKSIFILIFQKGNTHFFLKEATEIPGLETGNVCNLVQRDWFPVMFCNIIQDRIKPLHLLLPPVDILMKNFHAEIMIQLKQKLKDQTVKAQKVAVRADIIDDLELFQSGF